MARVVSSQCLDFFSQKKVTAFDKFYARCPFQCFRSGIVVPAELQNIDFYFIALKSRTFRFWLKKVISVVAVVGDCSCTGGFGDPLTLATPRKRLGVCRFPLTRQVVVCGFASLRLLRRLTDGPSANL